MTADDRWLEEQLAQFRPVQPGPRVAVTIARRLAPGRARPRRAALAALAASVLFLWFAWPASPRPPRSQVVKMPLGASAPAPVPLPSLAHYRQALADSPEALERMLDQPPGEDQGAGTDTVVAHSASVPD